MNKVFSVLFLTLSFTVQAYADCNGALACGLTGIDQVVTSCLTSFECAPANRDKLVLTASDLVKRTVVSKKCSRLRYKEECNVCYGAVKSQLSIKTSSSPLKRLTGQAIRLAEAERKLQCTHLPSVRDNGCGCS